MKYKLRAHHLLCLQFYVSKGYSEEFVSNMDKLYHNLLDDDLIEIIYKNDLLCNTCPNECNNSCKDIKKVNRYDFAIKELIGLDNNILTYKEYKKLVYENIILKDKLKTICSDCCWYDLCSSLVLDRINKYKGE